VREPGRGRLLLQLSCGPDGSAGRRNVEVHGPHGHFHLKEPITDSILIATGTGIAPMRGFAQWLFPEGGPDRSNGKEIWLVYGTRYETERYYHEEFEELAAKHPNFHFLVTLSRAGESWTGLRGYVQEYVGKIVEGARGAAGFAPRAAGARSDHSGKGPELSIFTPTSAAHQQVAAYVTSWPVRLHRKQIVFERYD